MPAGFTPNWYYGQWNAGLAIYIAPGDINGIHFNGGVFTVPNNATTVFYLTNEGEIQTEDGDYEIAQIVSGPIVTSTVGRTFFTLNGKVVNYNTDPGILSITDLRNW